MTSPTSASDAASAHYASYGAQEAQYGDSTTYGTYDATGFGATGHATTTFDADPLFGSLPGESTGAYDTTQWSTGSHHTVNYDAYAAQHHAAYDTGAYDTTVWTTDHERLAFVPQQAAGHDTSGQWDANAWHQPDQSGAPADQTQHWEWGTQAFDTGAYDATQWNSDGGVEATSQAIDEYEHSAESFDQQATAHFEHLDPTAYDAPVQGDAELTATGELPAVTPLLDDQEETAPAPAPRAASRSGSRSRRRTPPSAPRS